MSRKNEGFFALLTEMPWWVSVIVALFVYIFVRFLIPEIEFKNPGFSAFADGLGNSAHMVALIFLIPAPVAAYKAWEKGRRK